MDAHPRIGLVNAANTRLLLGGRQSGLDQQGIGDLGRLLLGVMGSAEDLAVFALEVLQVQSNLANRA